MRFFLTGATGFIGGAVARQLIDAGHEVVALVRSPEKARSLEAPGVDLYQGDITDRESMRAPMSGVDGVFHIAAWYELGIRDARRMERINVEGTRNVLTLMRELEIPRGVYTSTVAVYSDTGGRVVDESYYYDGRKKGWITEYNRTKWLAHYEVALPMIEEGLPLVVVLPGAVFGPGDNSALGVTIRQYLRRRLPMVPRTSAFGWTYVEDCARGHILAMEKGTPGESYIIGGPLHRTAEVLRMAEGITGIRAPRLELPHGLVNGFARMMGLVERVLPLPQNFTSEGLRFANSSLLGIDTKARRELGFDPRPLEEGLRETIEYEMERL